MFDVTYFHPECVNFQLITNIYIFVGWFLLGQSHVNPDLVVSKKNMQKIKSLILM